MNQQTKIIQTYGLWFMDMLCIAAAYLIATHIRFAGKNDYGDRRLHFLVCVVFLLFCTIYSFFVEWNRDFLIRGSYREMIAVLRFNVLMLFAGIMFVFFARWAYILSRSVIINFFWINFLLMLGYRLVFKKILRRVLSTDSLTTKLFVIAERTEMSETLVGLLDLMEMSYRVVGVAFADGKENAASSPADAEGNAAAAEEPSSAESGMREINGVPVYENVYDLTEKLTQLPFDEVFIRAPHMGRNELQRLVDGFEEMGVACHYNLELPDIGEATSRVGNFGNYTVITYSMFRSSYKRMMIKRLIDIAGAIVGLILTAVIYVFLAPAIRLDSPGPVIFSQIRVGKNGRRFRLYKFRSMYQDAEERKAQLQKDNEMSGLMFKVEDDPRITKVGHFIRRTSLDEFPQFWNVLKGDMSLVGTRPPTEDEFEQYDEHYRRRLSMKPGITGLWQVSGRSDITDFDEVVKLDLQYIDNWSLTLDFKILLQTVGAVFGGNGAK